MPSKAALMTFRRFTGGRLTGSQWHTVGNGGLSGGLNAGSVVHEAAHEKRHTDNFLSRV
jgi:hypothetical protein